MSFQNRYSQEPQENEQDYVYHYSAQRFSELRNRKMMGLPAPSEASDPEEYNQTVSLLPSPLSKETIEKYRASGFKAWGQGPLYEYKISIPKNVSAFPGEIRMTSVPDQLRYQKRYPFDAAFRKAGIDRQKAIRNDEYYAQIEDKYKEVKKAYWDNMDDYIRHMIAPALTARNYSTHNYIKDIKENFDYWLDFNLHRGEKTQYATYIPHIHTKIDKPLRPESVQQII